MVTTDSAKLVKRDKNYFNFDIIKKCMLIVQEPGLDYKVARVRGALGPKS